MSTDIEPAHPLTLDDLDAMIAARAEIDAVFWRGLALVKKQSGISANEIARRVGEAGIASRPTVLARLRNQQLTDLGEGVRAANAEFRRLTESMQRWRTAMEGAIPIAPSTPENRTTD